MNILHLLGHRFSNGMEFGCKNILHFTPTDRDWKLLKKRLESNEKRSIKQMRN